MPTGRLFVITGPSGVGKGTLIGRLLERVPALELSVSATTRPPRPGERDGVDYHFLSDEQFEALARPGRPGRRRDRELQLRHPLEQSVNQRPLADTRRPRDDEQPPGGQGLVSAGRGRYRRKWLTSSARWRCDRPPIVLLGEIRHWARILLTLTCPYFGTARSMSETFALAM